MNSDKQTHWQTYREMNIIAKNKILANFGLEINFTNGFETQNTIVK